MKIFYNHCMVETLRAEQLKDRIDAFIRINPASGVNNFVLKGGVLPVDIQTSVAVALFPSLYPEKTRVSIISINGEGSEAMRKYHSKIVNLKVDERVASYGVPNDEDIRKRMTLFCRLQGLPIMTILFGTYVTTGKDVVMMHVIAGISPETALREFQVKARERLSTLA